jgi:hypothetical protein
MSLINLLRGSFYHNKTGFAVMYHGSVQVSGRSHFVFGRYKLASRRNWNSVVAPTGARRKENSGPIEATDFSLHLPRRRTNLRSRLLDGRSILNRVAPRSGRES